MGSNPATPTTLAVSADVFERLGDCLSNWLRNIALILVFASIFVRPDALRVIRLR